MSAYSLFLVTIFISYVVHNCVGQQCDANGVQRFDSTCARLLTLGGSGRSFPENAQDQLKIYCDQSLQYIQDIDKYKNKCMKDMPKQLTAVLVYSIKNAINKYCKKQSKKMQEYIQGFVCANRAKKEIDQCYTNLIDSFQGAYNAKEKQRIPHICCNYYKLYDCLKERALKNKDCNELRVDLFSNFIKELFGNIVDLVCTDYVDGSDKCEKLEPTPKKKKNQRRTKSFMLPLIDSLASLEKES